MPATRSRMARERTEKQRRHPRTAGTGLNGDEHAHDSRTRMIRVSRQDCRRPATYNRRAGGSVPYASYSRCCSLSVDRADCRALGSAEVIRRCPALQGYRKNARQRAQGHRRAHGIPQSGERADSGADRLAQRGRAWEVGLRALLRARDVPRHARDAAGEVPRNHVERRSARQCQHVRRFHALLLDVRQGGSEHDPRDVRRHVQEPRVLRVGLQDRGSRSARRVQQEQRRAAPEADRSPARALLPGAHLQAHDDGLYRRHREHAQPVPGTRRCSSSAGIARSTRPWSSRAT